MSTSQREILAYCAAHRRTYADLISRFALPSDETDFYRTVFGEDLQSYYDVDRSCGSWEETTIGASEKGVAYLESIRLSDLRWRKTHRAAVAAIVISVFSLIVSIISSVR